MTIENLEREKRAIFAAQELTGNLLYQLTVLANPLPCFTKAVHRQQCLQGLEPVERIERPFVAYQATALPLSYTALYCISQLNGDKPREWRPLR